MSTTHSSYIPRDAHQPRGKRPWCAACDTDVYLVAQSPAVTDIRTGALVVAVSCSRCSQSRVLVATAEHAAALPTPSGGAELTHVTEGYLHCGELMHAPDPRAYAVQTFPVLPGSDGSLAAYLSTEVLRCRCGFQMELPS